MNIIYHHRTLGQGVEGVHISGVIRGFISAGHDVVEVSLGDSQATKRSDKRSFPSGNKTRARIILSFFVNNAPNFIFRVAEIFYNFIGFFKLRKAVKNMVKPSMIYDRYAYFSLISVIIGRLYKIPIITEVNITTDFDDTRKIQFRYLCTKIEQFVLERSDLIVVVSNVLKDKLLVRGIESKKIFVQPNGFSVDHLKIDISHIISRSFLKRTEDRIFLCFLGRLLPWYQLDKLLEIFSSLKFDYPEIALIIIGDGPEKAKLLSQVKRDSLSEDVFFTGNVSHVEALSLLSDCDICLLLSTNPWTSPVKLFEYMGAGKAVVAPNIESVSSIMQDGVHGKLFREGDFTAFRGALVSLLENKEELPSIGKNCRLHIEKNHTWDQVSKNILFAASERKLI